MWIFSMSYYYQLIIFAVLTTSAWSFSGGAPQKKETCDDLMPRHYFDAQTSKPPYILIASKTKISPSETIEITLKGKLDDDLFKGFLIQGRQKTETGYKIVGLFDVTPSNGFAQLRNCSSEADTITHKLVEGKGLPEVLFNWKPTDDVKGSVDIVATVAKTGRTFWVADTVLPISVE